MVQVAILEPLVDQVVVVVTAEVVLEEQATHHHHHHRKEILVEKDMDLLLTVVEVAAELAELEVMELVVPAALEAQEQLLLLRDHQ